MTVMRVRKTSLPTVLDVLGVLGALGALAGCGSDTPAASSPDATDGDGKAAGDDGSNPHDGKGDPRDGAGDPQDPPGETSALSLPRVPWEGGPDYYKKFPKAVAGGWTDPSFFPISVFLGKPSHAPKLKDVGVNTYMGAEHDGSKLTSITDLGMSVLAQGEWATSEIGDNDKVVGHVVSDECDMGLGCSGGNEDENLADQKAMVKRLRDRNDGRFMFANYGNGLLHTYWAVETMDDLMQLVDVASADKYFYTSPHIWGIVPDSPYWPKGAKVASSGSYGWFVDQMKRYLEPTNLHPNWMFIEVARPTSSTPTIRPAAATRSSIATRHGRTR